MRPFQNRLEFAGMLLWIAACTVVAMQYAGLPATIAVSTGALLGCLAARWTAQRGARLEGFLTLCPFLCALLLLASSELPPSSGRAHGLISGYQLAGILLSAGTAFCVSLAFDLLRAEFAQATVTRLALSVASFASPFVAHSRRPHLSPVLDQSLPVLVLLSLATVLLFPAIRRISGLGAKSPRLLATLHALRPQRALHPSVNS